MSNTAVDSEKLLPKRDLSGPRAQHSGNAPSQKTVMPRWSQKGKEQSTIALICTWIVDNQIRISATLLSVLYTIHMLAPSMQHHTEKFFRISYLNPRTQRYAAGWDDLCFVLHWIVVFTGMRCLVMEYVLSPLALKLGLRKQKARDRFAEQAWILIYYSMSWGTGMYIMYHSDYWLDLKALWKDFPTREIDGLTKWYYLVQYAFWLQQIVVVNIEAKRKDHWQMFTHHIMTCLLIFTSYGYHQTKVGTLILCLMDISDVFLPLAKILKYLKLQTACDIAFGVFMLTYFIPRHPLYLMVVWSIYDYVPGHMNYGCFKGGAEDLQGPLPVPNDWDHFIQPFYDPKGLVCMEPTIRIVFMGLLLALQVLVLMWFVLIVRVAYRVITGQGADEPRSDEEEEEEEQNYDKRDNYDGKVKSRDAVPGENPISNPETRRFIEKEVSSMDENFSTSITTQKTTTATTTPMRRSSRRKGEGSSSGVNLLGSDRKELLGRIGCDKPIGD